ncbi:hypothetical protein BS50DRAFT_586088 [Corynespora cassiicola Philippines]|uniref:Uncharacterized protein n=1 Tax=Corynespora cassiicola Philippines TaxID=1448308 RepID=A0A2T2NTN8_CORCC|nr:hypothetical protein BS50DRAFT_586088 [Corynespora cassiicola Philippines]
MGPHPLPAARLSTACLPAACPLPAHRLPTARPPPYRLRPSRTPIPWLCPSQKLCPWEPRPGASQPANPRALRHAGANCHGRRGRGSAAPEASSQPGAPHLAPTPSHTSLAACAHLGRWLSGRPGGQAAGVPPPSAPKSLGSTRLPKPRARLKHLQPQHHDAIARRPSPPPYPPRDPIYWSPARMSHPKATWKVPPCSTIMTAQNKPHAKEGIPF